MNIILILLAFICFVLAAVGVASTINLVALGLALWVLTLIIPISGGIVINQSLLLGLLLGAILIAAVLYASRRKP